jgi:hypothetical protein
MGFIYLPHIPCTSVLYNILIKFGIPGKLVGLIKKCLNETCNTGPTGRNLSDKFPLQDRLKQGDDLSPLLSSFALKYAIRRFQKNQERLISNGTHQVWLMPINIVGKNVTPHRNT